eukprot:2396689-Rhodomonas_salina.3
MNGWERVTIRRGFHRNKLGVSIRHSRVRTKPTCVSACHRQGRCPDLSRRDGGSRKRCGEGQGTLGGNTQLPELVRSTTTTSNRRLVGTVPGTCPLPGYCVVLVGVHPCAHRLQLCYPARVPGYGYPGTRGASELACCVLDEAPRPETNLLAEKFPVAAIASQRQLSWLKLSLMFQPF